MKKAALVIMAAGMASRYGGAKQIDGIGPNGEILMEYSIHDALRAGFTKIVFIVRESMIEGMKERCGNRIARQAEVCYAAQEFSSLPDRFRLPPERVKPYGTVHAVLCAAPYLNEPFAVINADDYYGVDGYRTMYNYLVNESGLSRAAMLGFELKNTVSPHGTVTRGICRVTDGRLSDVVETKSIGVLPDGTIANMADPEHPIVLNPNALVSMNFWGFGPQILVSMRRYFTEFLKKLPLNDVTSECLLPTFVDHMLHEWLEVKVLSTESKWYGMTYKEDRPAVAAALKRLHDEGVYDDIRER